MIKTPWISVGVMSFSSTQVPANTTSASCFHYHHRPSILATIIQKGSNGQKRGQKSKYEPSCIARSLQSTLLKHLNSMVEAEVGISRPGYQSGLITSQYPGPTRIMRDSTISSAYCPTMNEQTFGARCVEISQTVSASPAPKGKILYHIPPIYD